MVEEGFALLLQAGIPGSPATLIGVLGPFADVLPKDTISAATPMAVVYKTITLRPDYVLGGQTGWTDWTVQIDCHGASAPQAITLMRAVDAVLRGGFQGNLPDADSTYVFQVERLPGAPSGYSDANRSWVRSLEYVVSYQQW